MSARTCFICGEADWHIVHVTDESRVGLVFPSGRKSHLFVVQPNEGAYPNLPLVSPAREQSRDDAEARAIAAEEKLRETSARHDAALSRVETAEREREEWRVSYVDESNTNAALRAQLATAVSEHEETRRENDSRSHEIGRLKNLIAWWSDKTKAAESELSRTQARAEYVTGRFEKLRRRKLGRATKTAPATCCVECGTVFDVEGVEQHEANCLAAPLTAASDEKETT